MTINEAIQELAGMYGVCVSDNDLDYSNRKNEAIDMAIDALEKLTMCNEILNDVKKEGA